MHNDNQNTREELTAVAREMLDEMHQGLDSPDPMPVVAGLHTSKVTIEECIEIMEQIISGEFRDYRMLCDRIDLYMTANSSLWFRLRRCARQILNQQREDKNYGS